MPCSLCSCNFIPKYNKNCPGCSHRPSDHYDLYSDNVHVISRTSETRLNYLNDNNNNNSRESDIDNLRLSVGPSHTLTSEELQRVVSLGPKCESYSMLSSSIENIAANVKTSEAVTVPTDPNLFIESLSISLKDPMSRSGLSSIKLYENKMKTRNCASIFSQLIINFEKPCLEEEEEYHVEKEKKHFLKKQARYQELKKNKYSAEVYAYGPNNSEKGKNKTISVYQHNQKYQCSDCNLTEAKIEESRAIHNENIKTILMKVAEATARKPDFKFNINKHVTPFHRDSWTCHLCKLFFCREHEYDEYDGPLDVRIRRCSTCYQYTCSNCFIRSTQRHLINFACSACNAKAQLDSEAIVECFSCAEYAKPCSCLGIDCWPCKSHGDVKICDSTYHSVTCPQCGGSFCRDCENIQNHIIWHCNNPNCGSESALIRCRPPGKYMNKVMNIESSSNILSHLNDRLDYDVTTNSKKIIIPSNSFFASLVKNEQNKSSCYCSTCEKLMKFLVFESLIPLNMANVLVDIILSYCNIMNTPGQLGSESETGDVNLMTVTSVSEIQSFAMNPLPERKKNKRKISKVKKSKNFDSDTSESSDSNSSSGSESDH